jgi:hypothetical protein
VTAYLKEHQMTLSESEKAYLAMKERNASAWRADSRERDLAELATKHVEPVLEAVFAAVKEERLLPTDQRLLIRAILKLAIAKIAETDARESAPAGGR